MSERHSMRQIREVLRLRHVSKCTHREISLQAREALLRKDLIAVDGARLQVLSLPPEPVHVEPRPMPRRDQAAACRALIAGLATDAPK